MANRNGEPRRRRVYVVKGWHPQHQPDMWPGDEVWADDFTRLGIVSMTGEFIPNLPHGQRPD